MTLPLGPEEARLAAEIRQEPPLAVFQKKRRGHEVLAAKTKAR